MVNSFISFRNLLCWGDVRKQVISIRWSCRKLWGFQIIFLEVWGSESSNGVTKRASDNAENESEQDVQGRFYYFSVGGSQSTINPVIWRNMSCLKKVLKCVLLDILQKNIYLTSRLEKERRPPNLGPPNPKMCRALFSQLQVAINTQH